MSVHVDEADRAEDAAALLGAGVLLCAFGTVASGMGAFWLLRYQDPYISATGFMLGGGFYLIAAGVFWVRGLRCGVPAAEPRHRVVSIVHRSADCVTTFGDVPAPCRCTCHRCKRGQHAL